MMTDYDQTTGEIIEERRMPAAIAKAIIAVKKEVKQLGMDDKNPHGGYGYVSVDKFYATVGQLMAKHGLAIIIDETDSDIRAKAGGTSAWLFTRYEIAFMHEGGEMSRPVRRSCALPISGAQAYGAAQSYIEKQYLRQVFKVPTGEKDAVTSDKDADDTDNREDVEVPVRAQPRSALRAASAGNGATKPTLASVTQTDAQKRYHEIVAEIEKAEHEDEVAAIRTMPAWAACEAAIRNEVDEAQAEKLIAQMNNRANRRRDTIRRLRQGQEDMGL